MRAVAAPYWALNEEREQALFADEVDLDELRAWAPSRFKLLRQLADTGRAGPFHRLAKELLAAWDAQPEVGDAAHTVEALADALAWRAIRWGRQNNYQPPPDPAELILVD